MPFAAGEFVVLSFSRQVFEVIGIYPPFDTDINHAWRAVSNGDPPAMIFLQDSDADVNLTAFVLVPTAAPASGPALGSRVSVQLSPLAYNTGNPVAVFPITEQSRLGILIGYVTVPVLGATVYGLVTEPNGNIFIALLDELSQV